MSAHDKKVEKLRKEEQEQQKLIDSLVKKNDRYGAAYTPFLHITHGAYNLISGVSALLFFGLLIMGQFVPAIIFLVVAGIFGSWGETAEKKKTLWPEIQTIDDKASDYHIKKHIHTHVNAKVGDKQTAAQAKKDDACFMNLTEATAAGFSRNAGIPLGSFLENSNPIRYAGERHLITIAPNGTGKGACVQVPTLLEHDASILMIDPKGENAAITAQFRRDRMGQNVYILNPFGVLNDHFAAAGFSSSRFNPLAALDPSGSNFVADISALCEALILTEGKDPYFDNSARDLVACLIMYVCTEENETRTLPRVRQLLTAPPKQFESLLDLMADSDFAPLAQKAGVFLKDTKGNDAVISTARTQTSFLDDPCLSNNLSGSDFRFLDLKRKNTTVYIILPAKMVFTYSRWFRLLVTAGLDELMSTEKRGEKPVLFMLDEFPILGHLSSIETAIGLARGFGIQLWPFLQDFNQLKDIYHDRADSFFANSGVHQFFTPNDMKTAEYMEKRCGEVTTLSGSTTFSAAVSSSEAEKKTPLYSAFQLLSLPAGKQLLFLAGKSNPLLASRVPYYKNPRHSGKYAKNPYISSNEKQNGAKNPWLG